MRNVSWSSDEVKALFATGGGVRAQPTPEPGDPRARVERSGTGVSAGAIAGGVVGGLAGVSVVVAGLWLLLRRRKSSDHDREEGGEDAPEVAASEPKYYAYAVEADNESPYVEVPGYREAAELDPHHRTDPVELDGGYYEQRLSKAEK